MARTKTIITMLYDLLNLSDIRKPKVVATNPTWQPFGKICKHLDKKHKKKAKMWISTDEKWHLIWVAMAADFWQCRH